MVFTKVQPRSGLGQDGGRDLGLRPGCHDYSLYVCKVRCGLLFRLFWSIMCFLPAEPRHASNLSSDAQQNTFQQ